jgi:peptide/nickel transport system permease protein
MLKRERGKKMFLNGNPVFVENLRGILKQIYINKNALTGLIILSAVLAVSVFAPFLTAHDPWEFGERGEVLKPPDKANFMGTDEVGRDIWTQFIYGGRITLIVAFIASLISLTIGTFVGIVFGYFNNFLTAVLSRMTEMFLVLPQLPLMIAFSILFKPSITSVILVIGLISWSSTAKLVGSRVMKVKEYKYIKKLKGMGAGDFYIICNYVIPEILPRIFISSIFIFSFAVISESTLSFLGLGDPNYITWGMMLRYAFSSGAVSIRAYWYIIPPGLGITLVSFGFNLLGHSLIGIFNSSLRLHHLNYRE